MYEYIYIPDICQRRRGRTLCSQARQYSYFCTSKASKLNASARRRVSIRTFVLVNQANRICTFVIVSKLHVMLAGASVFVLLY